MRTLVLSAVSAFGLAAVPAVVASGIVSDGSDGPFTPTGNQKIVLNDLAPDGVFNFTTIRIPPNVRISFEPNDLNTPVFFAATGDVLIEGTIDVSGFGITGGPGGWDGGPLGKNSAGQMGTGPAPGMGGPPPAGQGNGGGGGGMATPGRRATSRTGTNPAAGGRAVPRPRLVPSQQGGGGSGGGGGGGRLLFGVDIPGGDGGGGAGGLQISTPARLSLTGKLLANGSHGGVAFANVFAHGGPGGGGAGGNIELHAGMIVFGETAQIRAIGGAGGGLSTEPVAWDPFYYSSGANGGQGYLLLASENVSIDAEATVDAIIVPAVCGQADFDDDGDVDAEDLNTFASCFSGPAVPRSDTPTCSATDLDKDHDVDQADFGIFQRCYSGENQLADPNCMK
ncbi:MAG: hypothetical protein KA354_08090 [Phycisphaerae bacterium]|nr:hypothetical protein [Phycisphaerae bacterium]